MVHQASTFIHFVQSFFVFGVGRINDGVKEDKSNPSHAVLVRLAKLIIM
jgi:hypothetical protein